MRTVAPGRGVPSSLVTVPEIVAPDCALATDAAQARSAIAAVIFAASCVTMVFLPLGGWVPETGRAIDMKRFNIRISFSSERCAMQRVLPFTFYFVNVVCAPDPSAVNRFPNGCTRRHVDRVDMRHGTESVTFRILDWCTGKYQVKCWTLVRHVSFGERPVFVRGMNR